MAKKEIIINLNGGDEVTTNSDLNFQFYDSSDNSILSTATYSIVGSKNNPGSGSPLFILDEAANGGLGRMTIRGVEVGTTSSVKVKMKDEVGLESILSNAVVVPVVEYRLKKSAAATSATTFKTAGNNDLPSSGILKITATPGTFPQLSIIKLFQIGNIYVKANRTVLIFGTASYYKVFPIEWLDMSKELIFTYNLANGVMTFIHDGNSITPTSTQGSHVALGSYSLIELLVGSGGNAAEASLAYIRFDLDGVDIAEYNMTSKPNNPLLLESLTNPAYNINIVTAGLDESEFWYAIAEGGTYGLSLETINQNCLVFQTPISILTSADALMELDFVLTENRSEYQVLLDATGSIQPKLLNTINASGIISTADNWESASLDGNPFTIPSGSTTYPLPNGYNKGTMVADGEVHKLVIQFIINEPTDLWGVGNQGLNLARILGGYVTRFKFGNHEFLLSKKAEGNAITSEDGVHTIINNTASVGGAVWVRI